MIVGDFNIHVDVHDGPDAKKFLDLIDSLGFKQHVNKPTHIHKHILGLAITRKTSNLIQDSPSIGRYFSDHAAVIYYLRMKRLASKVMTVSYRKLRSINMDSFHDDLGSSGLCRADYSQCRAPLIRS